MAVLAFRTLDQLYAGVRSLAHRLLSGHRLILSPEEFIAAYINPEHVEALKQTERIVGFVGTQSSFLRINTSDGTTLEGSVSFGLNRPPIILPQYVRQGMQPTAPDAVFKKVRAWADERYRLGRLFGDALDTLHWLNDNCGNAAAMSVMFPALPTILKTYNPDPESLSARRAQRIADAKGFGTLPKLPREVKNRMVECSDLLLTVSMLEPDTTNFTPKEREAEIDAQSLDGKAHPDFIYTALGQHKSASFV